MPNKLNNSIEIALNDSGVTLDDLFKLTIYIVQGQDVLKGFQGAQGLLQKLKNLPIISGIFVAGLASPDYLVEIEAMAFKPRH